MIALERAGEHDVARVRRRVAWRVIRQVGNRQILIVGRGADAKNPVRVEVKPVIESNHRRSRARAGRQSLGGNRAVVAKIHTFDDDPAGAGGIDAGRQGQHRERPDTPRFTGSHGIDIENDQAGAVIEVAVPIGDVNDAVVRQGANAERIVVHRHGDVGKIDIEPAHRIGRGRVVQAERAVKTSP